MEQKTLRGRTAENIKRWREEAQAEGREEGYHEGFSEGRVEAFEATRRAMEAGVQEFRTLLDARAESIEQAMAAWYVQAEENLAALAAVIAARILGRELETSKDAISDLARDAIREVSAVDRVRIRVNPLDHELLEKHRDLILAANPTVRRVEIVDDPAIAGGATIESDAGRIDATMRTQLDLAFKALRSAT